LTAVGLLHKAVKIAVDFPTLFADSSVVFNHFIYQQNSYDWIAAIWVKGVNEGPA